MMALLESNLNAQLNNNHLDLKMDQLCLSSGSCEEMDSQETSVETIKAATVHSATDAPRCSQCVESKRREDWFDFNCPNCVDLISNEETTVAQLMAIARQWIPEVQSNMDILVDQMLRRGAHPDDRDAVTDMTILHYVCKSGTEGLGDPDKSLQVCINLVEKSGADPNLCCRLNDMSALHFAVYYDVASIVGYLVTVVDPSTIDLPCAYLHSQTPLHLAASNLCLRSARILLSAGANILLKDDLMRTPLDCVPEEDSNDKIARWYFSKEFEVSLEMRALLEEATLVLTGEQGEQDSETMKTAKVVLSALGLEIGDRVVVNNAKVGTLRYCGPTQFAAGIWTGIELEEPIGKNDGSIDGVPYFVCPPDHGIFAPINKISKLDADYYDLVLGLNPNLSCKQINGGSGHHFGTVQSKIDTGLNGSRRYSDTNGLLSSSSSSVNSEDIHIGSRVYLSDKKSGIVRFIGTTKFATGIWYGIELTRPVGKNDGSVQGVRYFRCPDQYGLFVPFGRITRVMPMAQRASRKTVSSTFLLSASDVCDVSDDTSSDMSLPMSGTSSLDYHTTNGYAQQANPLDTNNNTAGHMLRRSLSLRRSVSTTSTLAKRSIRKSTINSHEDERSWLQVGCNVLVNGNVAVLRYIGPVHFAEGTYLGVELRTATGKNDGTVEGKRYFQCRANHGLMVPPKKVTIHGISAAKLLSENKKKSS